MMAAPRRSISSLLNPSSVSSLTMTPLTAKSHLPPSNGLITIWPVVPLSTTISWGVAFSPTDLSAGRICSLETVSLLYQEDRGGRSEEHTSELQSRLHLVCRLLLEKKKQYTQDLLRPPSH